MARRDRVEALLTSAELQVLAEMAAAVCVPFSRWPESPQLARPWLALAVERAAARFRAERAWSWTRAREAAAAHLGVEFETLRTWRRRWRPPRKTGGQSDHTPRAPAVLP